MSSQTPFFDASRIARLTVQAITAASGRGPTSASASGDGKLGTLVLREVLTAPERRLIELGHQAAVETYRQAIYSTILPELTLEIERIVSRAVISSHAHHQYEEDILVLSFVFGPTHKASAGPGPGQT